VQENAKIITSKILKMRGLYMNQPLTHDAISVAAPEYVKNQKLIQWVAEVAALTKPDTFIGAMVRKPNMIDSAISWWQLVHSSA
jgi:hypothetical protein